MTELARDSVVEIFASRSTGTGWIYRVDRNGKAWILTNEHVIRGARTVTVRLSGTGGSRTGTIVGQDEIRDLAVLTICCNSRWEALPTVATNRVDVGSDVAVLGFPGGRIGQDLAVTRGIVSSFGFHDESRSWLIQTDAAINPGNSGGPMLNARGQVVGIVSSRRDPVTAENIGFAISMRTVEQELDYLEVGRTVQASPTPRPTRVPTVGPSTSGVTGVLAHDPDSGSIGCSSSRYSNTVISNNTTDSAAYLRFEVPNVRQWSIGFLYHDPATGGTTDTATVVYANPDGDLFASHWVRVDGEDVGKDELEFISAHELMDGAGQTNELSFRTSSKGSVLRLNDFIFEIPDSNLLRKAGMSQICVGFWSDENAPYTIRYSNLRTQFELDGASGVLNNDGIDDGQIDCPEGGHSLSVLSSRAIDIWSIFDFATPVTDSKWSIGILYHNVADFESATLLYSNGPYRLGARHWSHSDGVWEYPDEKFVTVERRLLKSPGSSNTIEMESTANGTWLRLNGEKVLAIGSADLRRRSGHAQICVGFHNDESEPYTIRFSNLWVWAE